jgi:hypothetical protein
LNVLSLNILSQFSCPSCPLLSVMFWLYCPCFYFPAGPSRLSSQGCTVSAVLSLLSCFSCPISARPSYLVRAVLSLVSCSGRSFLSSLSWMFCLCFSWLSSPGSSGKIVKKMNICRKKQKFSGALNVKVGSWSFNSHVDRRIRIRFCLSVRLPCFIKHQDFIFCQARESRENRMDISQKLILVRYAVRAQKFRNKTHCQPYCLCLRQRWRCISGVSDSDGAVTYYIALERSLKPRWCSINSVSDTTETNKTTLIQSRIFKAY